MAWQRFFEVKIANCTLKVAHTAFEITHVSALDGPPHGEL